MGHNACKSMGLMQISASMLNGIPSLNKDYLI